MASVGAGAIGGKHGIDVLRGPETSESTAFNESEREALGLTGLLPSGIDGKRSRSGASCSSSGQRRPTWSDISI